MEIARAVLLLLPLIFAHLAIGHQWSQHSNEISSLTSDNQGGGCKEKFLKLDGGKAKSFAQKAAKAAKDASDAQMEAGAAASRQAQKQLADKACSAAKAAEAAYVGKQQLVNQIESELREGKVVVNKESTRLQTTKVIAADAQQGVKQAAAEVKALTDLVKKARDSFAFSERVVLGAQQALSNQQEAMGEAKERMELLLRQMEVARADYQSTKTAAEHAAKAAQEAKERAARERRMVEIFSHQGTYPLIQ